MFANTVISIIFYERNCVKKFSLQNCRKVLAKLLYIINIYIYSYEGICSLYGCPCPVHEGEEAGEKFSDWETHQVESKEVCPRQGGTVL